MMLPFTVRVVLSWYIEVPEMKVEDFSAAIDFLSNHVLVDKIV